MADGVQKTEKEISVTDILKNRLEGVEDILSLLQLDLVNMKNEIDKMKMISGSPLSEDVEKNLVELEKIARKVDVLKDWEKTIKEVRLLREQMKLLENISSGDAKAFMERLGKASSDSLAVQDLESRIKNLEARIQRPVPLPEKSGTILDDLKKEIERLKSAMQEKPPAPRDKAETKEKADSGEIESLRKELEDLKAKISRPSPPLPKAADRGLDELKRTIEENSQHIKRLEESYSKASKGADIEKLRKAVEDLKGKMTDPEQPAVVGDLERLKSSLGEKLKELNSRADDMKGEELKKAVQSNRESIERLGMILQRRTESSAHYTPSALREKLDSLEKEMEVIKSKVDRISKLKPIDIPEVLRLKAMPQPPIKLGKADTGSLKKNIEQIIGRLEKDEAFLKTLATKDDVREKITGGKDTKLVSDSIYKDMEDIRKIITRNEKEIDTLATDMDRMKANMKGIEKESFSKDSAKEVELLERRLQQLERSLRSPSGGAFVIE